MRRRLKSITRNIRRYLHSLSYSIGDIAFGYVVGGDLRSDIALAVETVAEGACPGGVDGDGDANGGSRVGDGAVGNRARDGRRGY